ncbi:unnamed protein product [Calypogeia fissa]
MMTSLLSKKKLLAIFLFAIWALHVGAASGLFSMFSDPGSSFNLTSAGFAWVSTMEGSDLKDNVEGNVESDGKSKPSGDVNDAEVETAFTSIDSMLQWAIGHADPEKLKSTAQDVQGMTPQQLEKRQAELKEIMEKLRMKSDADLMKISLADLQNNSSPAADRQRALQELLELVEPIDNALDLNKLGGLAVVIGELERDEGELRTTAAWVLGKASQNNPVVQNQLLRLGALPKLMKMVRSNDNEEAVKALYAVSALIRNFPSGQDAFYVDGGAALLQVLLSGENVDPRLKKKALYLLAELAEQQTDMEGELSDGVHDKLLIAVVKLAEANDLDTQEKALLALRNLIGLNNSVCERLQKVCQVDDALERLRIHYKVLILDPELADYIKDLEVLRDEVAEALALSTQDSRLSQDEGELHVDR